MTHRYNTILLLLSVLLFTGCFSYYPLNLSEEEYNQLSFEQKIKAKEYQAKLDNEETIERLKNQREREKYQYTIALKEQENLQQLYQQNSEVLYVAISGGSFGSMKKGYSINPFTIRPFEVKKIPVYSNYNYIHHYIWVSLQEEGLYLGVTPKDGFEHLNRYTSFSHALTNSYYKPTVIAKSAKWYHDAFYKISFQNNYNANNINVKLYLESGNKRGYKY